MIQNKTYSLLGIAAKAGKTALGATAVEKTVKSGRSRLVVIADTASPNTRKKFENMCTFYKVPFYIFGDAGTLGHAVGSGEHAVIAVLDEGLACAVAKSLEA